MNKIYTRNQIQFTHFNIFKPFYEQRRGTGYSSAIKTRTQTDFPANQNTSHRITHTTQRIHTRHLNIHERYSSPVARGHNCRYRPAVTAFTSSPPSPLKSTRRAPPLKCMTTRFLSLFPYLSHFIAGHAKFCLSGTARFLSPSKSHLKRSLYCQRRAESQVATVKLRSDDARSECYI